MGSASKTAFIHESSYVDEGVSIGDETQIWHFCHLLSGTKIGERCRIGQNVVIGPRVEIGNNVKIQNNVSVYEGVTLEDNVFCGPSMVFTNVTTPRCQFPRNTADQFAVTHVGQGASIGANATIICGVTIGHHALIGAGAVITKDVPPYGLVYGNPARQHGWACECGVRLQCNSYDNTSYACPDCRRAYQLTNSQLIRKNSSAA
jgi:UDP-2-acetamido-3-amino-2,3-dideoxy-glucuronate N-acetyltransferase